MKATTQNGTRQTPTPEGEGDHREAVSPGDVAREPAVRRCLWVRELKGSSSLGSLQPQDLSYLGLADVGYNFMGYAKQVGSKWLKISLSRLCLKQLNV